MENKEKNKMVKELKDLKRKILALEEAILLENLNE